VPLPVLHAVGAFLGWTIYSLSPRYRKHLNDNLAQAGIADASVRHEAIAHAGKMLAELPALWFRPQQDVARLVHEVQGAELAVQAHERGEAVLFMTPHMGSFEVTSQYVSVRAAELGVPVTVLYRRPKLGWMEPLMRAGRDRGNVRLVPADVTGVRELFAALRRKEVVGFLPDQVPGQGEGEWAEFFGRPAYTMTLAARLAARPGIACFLAYARRLPRGGGYSIHVRPYPAALAGEGPVRQLNRALEAVVRECPGQYLWSYNRYKAPKGAPPPPGTGANSSR
ncbi:MAG: lysophospholipid acyltransferase family protein, partial [Clostridia bacterium]